MKIIYNRNGDETEAELVETTTPIKSEDELIRLDEMELDNNIF